jgi:hypothetical protein
VAQLATLLQTMSIQTKGTAIEISLAIPEDVIEQLGPRMHQPRVEHRRVVEKKR